jgi:hypothetical protein
LDSIRELAQIQAATEFKRAIEDWNLYCFGNRYATLDRDFVQRQVAKRKVALDEEGRQLLLTWVKSRVTTLPKTASLEPTISPPVASPPISELASGDSLDQVLVEEAVKAQERTVAQNFDSILSGTWAGNPDHCSQKRGKSALLVSINSQKAARANVSCNFLRMNESNNAFSVTAHCSNGTEQWDANISLARSGNKLTWSSELGTDTFYRCEGEL